LIVNASLAVGPLAGLGWIIERANVKLNDVLAWESHGLGLPGQRRPAFTAKRPFDARG
jgi:hypothetical protein